MDWTSSGPYIIVFLVLIFWQLRKISNQLDAAHERHRANGLSLGGLDRNWEPH
ncbi:hypothetical protein [Amphritea sp.]|uniref:hypothetical protein n=1 Tax=Amphritea sp. TaxID=1872502 RepID=UPI0025B8214F|nr:hypothetical protein [Amphritea sp.]